MLRTVLTAVGVVEVLSPEALVDAAERIALENPDECEPASWVVPAARLEGFAVLVLAWRSERSYSALRRFLGVVGILALVYPRAYVDHAAGLAYAGAGDPEWRSWVYPATRIVGLLYVLVALDELRGD